MEYLLKQFTELEGIPNEAEDYPIHFASAAGDPALISCDTSDVIFTIGHLEVVKTFVKFFGKEVISRKDVNGTLPAYFAAQEGNNYYSVVDMVTTC